MVLPLLWLLQRDQPLHTVSAVQVDEAPADCILLKTVLFSYQWLMFHLYRELGHAERPERLQG